MSRWLLILALVSLTCCSDGASSGDTPPGPTSSPRPSGGALVNLFDWEVADADPFADTRPEGADCDPEAHGTEELGGFWVYSIETEACGWLTLRQPTAVAASPGDHIQVSVWHFALTAPEPATALVGLALADRVLVTMEEPIPAEGRLMLLDHIVETPVPAGTDLYFHLHNHGANSWHLVEVTINPE